MKNHLALVFIILFSFIIHGQESVFSVEYITIQNGLADNTINSIIKDNTGFMWFGTNNGISKFDGYNIQNFNPNNYFINVLDLLQTEDGLIWCPSSNGLYCFDPKTEQFISLSNNKGSKKIIEGKINSICKGKNQSLWIASSQGLWHLSQIDKESLRNNTFNSTHYDTTNSTIPSSILTSVLHDSKKPLLWIGSWDQFLFNFNTDTREFNKIPIKIHNYNHKKITTINTLYSQDSTLWIGTIQGGLVKMNTSNYTYEIIEHQKTQQLSHNDIYGIQSDFYGNLWVGTWNGIDHIHKKSNARDPYKIEHYNRDHPFFNEKLENRISTLYWDDGGTIWIGTFGGGVVKIDFSNNKYKRYKFDSRYEINSFTEDKDGFLWISMYHGGIKKSNEKISKNTLYTFKNFTKKQSNSGLTTDIILCAAKDNKENIWFGTDESTLYKKDKNGEGFSVHKIAPINQPTWKEPIKALHIDNEGVFWIGTDKGLLRYDKKKGDIQRIPQVDQKNNHIETNYIKCITQDSEKTIWVGTCFGIQKVININNHYFLQSFDDISISSEVLINKEVWTIYEDNKQNLWIGYRGGLGHYDRKNNNFTIHNIRDGLANNFVSCIIEDNENNLWLGTASGISKFNLTSKKFENLYIANNNRAAFKDNFGNLYFGNNNGFVTFNPKNIKRNKNVPAVIISDLIINNRSVSVNTVTNGQVILNKTIPYTSSIRLEHLNESFALEFNSLSFPFKEFNKYAYKLEGLDVNWTEVNSRSRIVSFHNLAAGDYTFLVKAANSEGIWNTKATKLHIKIVPAWWDTWWAKLLLIITITFLLLAIYYIRIRRIYVIEHQNSERIKLEHTLKTAKFEKNKETELSEIKSKFFTNLSHEIRTPLTLILTPLHDLIQSDSLTNKIKEQLKPIEKNAFKLLKLVNQLMDFRKIISNRMQLQISEIDIDIFVKEIFDSFIPLAKQQNIRYNYINTQGSFKMWFDRTNMEIVITNLIQNAFKFSPTNSEITIKIDVFSIDNCCKISVKDTGKGISKKDQLHLFERYYQASKSTDVHFKGSGIGLSLVKEIIDLHNGKITIDSTYGKGAAFQVTLPIRKEQYPSAQILKLPEEISKKIYTDFTTSQPQIDFIKKENNKHILLVEDNPEILLFLKKIFQESYQISEATNGIEALNIIEIKHPDLIICDLMMPVMDGVTLCQKLKKELKTSYIPIILLTANTNEIKKIEALASGVDAYITKPFETQVLKAKVENCIENRKRLKNFFSKKITLEPHNIEIKSSEEIFLLKTIKLIENNLTSNTFNVKILAEKLNMSQATLYRKVKMFTDLSITQFIKSIRLKRAAQLLKLQKYSISEISNMVGFSDIAYFRKIFFNQFDMNPSVYAKKHSPPSKSLVS